LNRVNSPKTVQYKNPVAGLWVSAAPSSRETRLEEINGDLPEAPKPTSDPK